MDNKTIGSRLKHLRKLKGYTLKQVSDAACIDSKMYQHYEAGRVRTPVTLLLFLSELYGFHSVDMVLGLQEQKKFKMGSLQSAYANASAEKRKIIDFILSLNS